MDRPQPAFASIPNFQIISGLNRSAVYAALGRGDLRAIKVGRRVFIDVERGLAWLHGMPAPHISPPPAPAAATK